MDTTLQQYGTIEATFSPKHLDTLRDDARQYIGQRMRFTVAWWIDDEDGGPYVGQWACLPADRQFGWVPETDLSEIVTVG
jgi:hypothetical protein